MKYDGKAAVLHRHAARGHGQAGSWATLATLAVLGIPASAEDLRWCMPVSLATIRKHLGILLKEGAIHPAGTDRMGRALFVPDES